STRAAATRICCRSPSPGARCRSARRTLLRVDGVQRPVTLDVGLELRAQRRFFLGLDGELMVLGVQLIDGAHQILRQIIRHAPRARAPPQWPAPETSAPPGARPPRPDC